MNNYTVKSGDTLTSIASNFQVSIRELMQANNLTSSEIKVGEVLIIPAKEEIYDYYKIKKNDTLYKIARLNNTTAEILRQLNGLDENDYLYPVEMLLVPKKGLAFYITKSGDSIASVSAYFNTSSKDLVENNASIYLVPDQLLIYRK